MPLRMFRLAPGGSARFRVRPIGGAPRVELGLDVLRPDEGPSTELELRLLDKDDGVVDVGRIPMDAGYMAVLRALRRQLDSVSIWRENKEFDLVAVEDEADVAPARLAGEQGR